MRLVQVTIPAGKREAVLSALDEEGVDYVVTEETSGREYTAVATFPVPTAAVEPVLERLREAGVERDAYTVVLDAETVVSRKFEVMVEQYAEDADEDRIAREELRANARELAPGRRSYLLLTVISVVIATAGVLLDSAATVVGSMVIAPLIGPAMATSVGTVVGDRELFQRGLRLQALGFGAAVLAAAGFAFFVKTVGLIPPGTDVLAIAEVQERVAPGVLTLAIALGAGVAGAQSLRTGVSASLVGVMIAVALVPPVAVVGIGIAWGLPTVVVGASVLVLVNALSINLAALVTLWQAGYAPERLFAVERSRQSTIRQASVLVVAILVLSAALGGVTVNTLQEADTAKSVRGDVRAALSAPEYADIEAIEVDVVFTPLEERPVDGLLTPTVDHVVVTVGRPPGTVYESLADRLAAAIEAPTGSVEVRYVDVQRSEGATVGIGAGDGTPAVGSDAPGPPGTGPARIDPRGGAGASPI